jgi:hypothetical protein
MVWLSCDEKSPTRTEKGPALNLRQTTFSLRGGGDRVRLFVRNSGQGVLEWNVASKPEWISVSRTSGRVEVLPDTLQFETDTDSIAYGDYQAVLRIESNGGNADLQISLSHNAPIIKVWLPILNFSVESTRSSMLVYNVGGDFLGWNVVSQPDWVNLSRSFGNVAESPDTVFVEAPSPYENRQGTIEIESNGGNSIVAVNLMFERPVEIIPSVGASKIKLGDSYADIKSVHGNPLYLVYKQVTKTQLHYKALYGNKGLTFEFLTEHMLWESDPTNRITVEAPYFGLTENGISVGSTLSQVVSAYGPPPVISTADSSYQYEGIAFRYDADSTYVRKIHIPR